jgi:hypothetical protein
MVEVFHAHFAKTVNGRAVEGVEVPLLAALHDPDSGEVVDEALVGTMDLVLRHGDHRIVVEHKTAARKWSDDQLAFDLQLSGYRLAGCPGLRPAAHRERLAASQVPRPLGTPLPCKARQTSGGQGDPGSHPQDVDGEPALGLPAHRRLLRGARGDLQGPVRRHHPRARSAPDGALQRDGAPYRPVDRPPDLRGVPLGSGAALPAPGSRPCVWPGLPNASRGHGHRPGAHRTSQSLAEPVRRAGDRQRSPRVPGPLLRERIAQPHPPGGVAGAKVRLRLPSRRAPALHLRWPRRLRPASRGPSKVSIESSGRAGAIPGRAPKGAAYCFANQMAGSNVVGRRAGLLPSFAPPWSPM